MSFEPSLCCSKVAPNGLLSLRNYFGELFLGLVSMQGSQSVQQVDETISGLDDINVSRDWLGRLWQCHEESLGLVIANFLRSQVNRNLASDRARIVGQHEILHRRMAVFVLAREQQTQRGKIVRKILLLAPGEREHVESGLR